MKLEERKTVAIIGQGYVGLPLAMAATDAGWSVVGIDTDKSKVLQERIVDKDPITHIYLHFIQIK